MDVISFSSVGILMPKRLQCSAALSGRRRRWRCRAGGGTRAAGGASSSRDSESGPLQLQGPRVTFPCGRVSGVALLAANDPTAPR